MYIHSDSQTYLAIFAQQSAAPSCQAGTAPADFTYLDYLLLCGGWCDR